VSATPTRRAVIVAVGDAEKDRARNYVAALELSGVPDEAIRVIQPRKGREEGVDYRTLAAEAAGLVLAGGEDVEPGRYGEDEIPEAQVYFTPKRDEMELALLAGARDAGVPVWGVCRGIQMLNVFLGGTLWQDLALQLPTQVLHQLSNPDDALIHAVKVDDPTVSLGLVLAHETALVNSRHHQGVKDLGEGLVPVGHAPDGLVEAVYLESESWWVRAVQWHPENLTAMAQQRELWHRFARRVGYGNGNLNGRRER
jgi:putative glutamine amidotransferase